MTDKTTQGLVVTQADRDAAAAWAKANVAISKPRIYAGEAFARHRIAALRSNTEDQTNG